MSPVSLKLPRICNQHRHAIKGNASCLRGGSSLRQPAQGGGEGGMPLMRFARSDVRDHVFDPKSIPGLRSGARKRCTSRDALRSTFARFWVVRFSTFATISVISGPMPRPVPCPLGANRRLTQRSNYQPYSITWSARTRNDSGIVRVRRPLRGDCRLVRESGIKPSAGRPWWRSTARRRGTLLARPPYPVTRAESRPGPCASHGPRASPYEPASRSS